MREHERAVLLVEVLVEAQSRCGEFAPRRSVAFASLRAIGGNMESPMTTSNGTPRASNFEFPYITCRNISGPEDEDAGRKVYAGHAPTSSVLPLEDDENVREYLVDALGKAKARPTLVHQAIRKTLADQPDQFSILNGGMVIVARAAEVDDKRKVLILKRPSIINGSQTQGELKRYFQNRRHGDDFCEPSIKFELIVTADDDLIAEVSISRNFQNDVRAISIAGRRGQLDELEKAVQRVLPNAKLRKSETDLVVDDDEFLDTEKLIQVLFALMPPKLFRLLEKDAASKVFAYSQKTRCLKLFQRIVEGRQGDENLSAIHAYFLDMAGDAWTLYERWKRHTGFQGTRLRSIERENGEIANVPDGIVFPILSALSEFVTVRNHIRRLGTPPRGHWGDCWELLPVKRFDEQELIDVAKQVYMEIADHNPQTMGKSKACYSALQRITAIYARLAGPAIDKPPFNPAFLKKVDELELSLRSRNCLASDSIVYLGDLVQRNEYEMLRTPNFGRKSVNEIKEVLAQMGLHLGMEVPGWPPDNIDELAERFDDHY
jgi:Bacterial RNA polymerase, alpha chain C terminal domain/AIPR protein